MSSSSLVETASDAVDEPSPGKYANLQSIFRRLCQSLEVDESKCGRWWSIISEKYSECHRRYHNLDHLVDMFSIMKENLPFIPFYFTEATISASTSDSSAESTSLSDISVYSKFDLQSIALAIMFHDVIYDPKSDLNEENSAHLFDEFVDDCTSTTSGNLLKDIRGKVNRMIIATKSHAHSDITLADDDIGLHFFLDVDMAVLGREREGYQSYARQVRQEYIHVDETVYCERRSQFLRKMLEGPQIYSHYFTKILEEKARANIEWESSILESGVIP